MDNFTIRRLAVPFHPPNWVKFPVLTIPVQSNSSQDNSQDRPRQETRGTQTEQRWSNGSNGFSTTNGRRN